MKHFNKLYFLFNLYNNYNNCNSPPAIYLSKKFQKLLYTFKKEDCPDFIEETSLLINLLDSKTDLVKKFMKEIIEKSSLPMEMIFQIYIYLSNNCNNSKNVVESIIEYFAKNKNYLSPDNIIYLLNNLQSEKIIFNDGELNKKVIFPEEKFFHVSSKG